MGRVAASAMTLLLSATAGGAQTSASAELDPVSRLLCQDNLEYTWRLRGGLSGIAGLFLPSRGTGVLTTRVEPNGRVVTGLNIESPDSKDGEYWDYGARVDPASGEAEEVWSSYRWRGKEEASREELADGTVDIVSGIWRLRRELPERPERLDIWSDGKLYPVIIEAGPPRPTTVCAVSRQVRTVTIRGLRVEGRRYWKGSLRIDIADDPRSTPLQITLDRGWASLVLDLVGGAAGKDSPHCGLPCPATP